MRPLISGIDFLRPEDLEEFGPLREMSWKDFQGSAARRMTPKRKSEPWKELRYGHRQSTNLEWCSEDLRVVRTESEPLLTILTYDSGAWRNTGVRSHIHEYGTTLLGYDSWGRMAIPWLRLWLRIPGILQWQKAGTGRIERGFPLGYIGTFLPGDSLSCSINNIHSDCLMPKLLNPVRSWFLAGYSPSSIHCPKHCTCRHCRCRYSARKAAHILSRSVFYHGSIQLRYRAETGSKNSLPIILKTKTSLFCPTAQCKRGYFNPNKAKSVY